MQLEFYLSNQAYMGSLWSILYSTVKKGNQACHKFLGIFHLQ